jgi:hypothetical protein
MNISVQPLSGHDLTGIVMFAGLFLGAALTAIVYCVVTAWLEFRRLRLEASLKMELIKQGRSAEEIERIIKASGRPAAPLGGQPPPPAATALTGGEAAPGVATRAATEFKRTDADNRASIPAVGVCCPPRRSEG